MRNAMQYIPAVFLAFGLSFTACTGDLDVTPADPEISIDEEFYSRPEAYKEGLAGVYANLTLTGTTGPGDSNIDGLDAGTSNYSRTLWYLQELPTDEVKWTYENDPGTAELNRTTWTPNNAILTGMFGRGMAQVAFANEYLRQTTEGVLNDRGVSESLREEIQMYRAEVRFLRALAYYHLMDLFGKAPFITEDNVVGAYQPPQYDREQLFEFIEAEMLEIIPAMAEPLQNEYGRADKAAAWMLLAKIYLNAEVYTGTERYADCITYCNEIMNAGFSLASDYRSLFMADNNLGESRNEIIFPIVNDGETTQNYGATTVMINGQVGSIEQNGLGLGVSQAGWGGGLRVPRQLSTTMLQAEYDNDDRNRLVLTDIDDRTLDITTISVPSTGYIIDKWSNQTSTGEDGKNLTFVDTDFPLFRLGDVYLMYAEAHLRGGGGTAAEALQLVNELRTRADNPETVTGSELNLNFILEERMVELYWEAHRRQDLIRFDQFTGSRYVWNWKGNSVNGIGIADYRAVYPIPANSLAANPNLIQNTGY